MDDKVVTFKEVLEWCREEDTGDLKISELNELVESMKCLNALEGKIGKIYQNVLTECYNYPRRCDGRETRENFGKVPRRSRWMKKLVEGHRDG